MNQLLKSRISKILMAGFLIFSGIAYIPSALGSDDAAKVTRVYLAGDSTVKTYGLSRTTGGWGEYLQNYFNIKNVVIINKAEGGRSARSFINQGRLEEILAEIRAGDYLFIQFGHNDSSTGPDYELERSVKLGTPDANGIYPVIPGEMVDTPQKLRELKTSKPYGEKYYPYESGTFKWYLKQYVDGARERGAIPVLVTPVSRMYFSGDKIIPHHGENDAYVRCVLQLAKEMNVDYIDMFAMTKAMYEKLGEKASEKFHDLKPDGTIDKTHYNKYGAFVVAGMVAEAIQEKGLGLAKDIIAPAVTVEPPKN